MQSHAYLGEIRQEHDMRKRFTVGILLTLAASSSIGFAEEASPSFLKERGQ